jgi:hypothetical protein
MIAAAIAVTILVGLTILVHYEVLRLTSATIPMLAGVRPHGRVVLVVFACFAAHTIEVWLFAVAYFLFVDVLRLGGFGGIHHGHGEVLAPPRAVALAAALPPAA